MFQIWLPSWLSQEQIQKITYLLCSPGEIYITYELFGLLTHIEPSHIFVLIII